MSQGNKPETAAALTKEVTALKARVAELEAAFVTDYGDYRGCLYCRVRWPTGGIAPHHELCVLHSNRTGAGTT